MVGGECGELAGGGDRFSWHVGWTALELNWHFGFEVFRGGT